MKFAHTMIRVRDLKATMDFYRELIGLQEVRRREIGDEATLVFLTDEAGDYRLEFFQIRAGGRNVFKCLSSRNFKGRR